MKEFIGFIEKYPLIAYNSDFDMSFLQHNCQKKLNITIDNDVIDALPLARKYLPGLPNKKLETVKQHFELNVGSHNAIDDCIVTNHLYQYCKQIEAKKYKYDIPFSYNPEDLSDIELEYLSVIIAICEKNSISKKQLSMHSNGNLLVIEYCGNTLVSLKLNGRLQYVLFEIPFVSFSEKYSTDLKVTAGVKSEGDTTRVFTDSADQLWEFEQLIANKRKRVWSKT